MKSPQIILVPSNLRLPWGSPKLHRTEKAIPTVLCPNSCSTEFVTLIKSLLLYIKFRVVCYTFTDKMEMVMVRLSELFMNTAYGEEENYGGSILIT